MVREDTNQGNADRKAVTVKCKPLHSGIKIETIEAGKPVKPGMLYILPPGYYASIENSVFQLEQRGSSNANWAINIFFDSLAKNAGSKNIGIILSGTGTDGTKGAHALKQTGGTVFVQLPQSCDHAGMPESVINAGDVDYSMLTSAMPAQIHKLENN